MRLKWYYNGEGQWHAESELHDDGACFTWSISMTDDGQFSVFDSDSELTDREETFASLKAAKEFCDTSECVALGFAE
jgi:hypothetical protein